MSLATNIADLATRIATEVKALRTLINGNAANLSALTTTDKTNIVAAINEVKGSVSSAAGINDATTSTSSTWSSSKTSTELGTKAASSHSHAIGDLPVATSGTSNTTQLVRADDSRLSNARTPTTHSHAIADLPVATSGTSSTTQLVRADDARLSNSRTPTAHTHATSEVTGLDTALAGKAATSHTHTAANVTDFNSAVDARISNVVAGAPTTLDTLDELAAALGDDPNFATTTTTALGNRVRADAAQSFTGPQQTQARSNIGAADASAVGDTSTNFVTTFEAGLV